MSFFKNLSAFIRKMDGSDEAFTLFDYLTCGVMATVGAALFWVFLVVVFSL